jgi:hypothetical protein
MEPLLLLEVWQSPERGSQLVTLQVLEVWQSARRGSRLVVLQVLKVRQDARRGARLAFGLRAMCRLRKDAAGFSPVGWLQVFSVRNPSR